MTKRTTHRSALFAKHLIPKQQPLGIKAASAAQIQTGADAHIMGSMDGTLTILLCRAIRGRTPLHTKLALLALATLSGCWLFEVADLTHPIEAGAAYWARCDTYLDESVKTDSSRPKTDPDPHNQAWLDCIQRQRNAKRAKP